MASAAIRFRPNPARLRKELMQLTRTADFNKALEGWQLLDVEILKPGEKSRPCLCGHAPVAEVMTLFHATALKTAFIGDLCIWNFYQYNPLEEVYDALQHLKLLQPNPNNSASFQILRLAQKLGVITQEEKDAYDNWRKKPLTSDQKYRKRHLHECIILGLRYPATRAFNRLKRNINVSAGPKLIKLAFEKGVFDIEQRNFYLSIWKISRNNLDPATQKRKRDLNLKLIGHEAVLDLQLTDRPIQEEEAGSAAGVVQRRAV